MAHPQPKTHRVPPGSHRRRQTSFAHRWHLASYINRVNVTSLVKNLTGTVSTCMCVKTCVVSCSPAKSARPLQEKELQRFRKTIVSFCFSIVWLLRKLRCFHVVVSVRFPQLRQLLKTSFSKLLFWQYMYMLDLLTSRAHRARSAKLLPPNRKREANDF